MKITLNSLYKKTVLFAGHSGQNEKTNEPKKTIKSGKTINTNSKAIDSNAIASINIAKKAKFKKDLIKHYDEVYNFIQTQSPDLNFIKPKLAFKDLGENATGGYSFGDNTIYVNSRDLDPSKLYKSKEIGVAYSTETIRGEDLYSYFYQPKQKESYLTRATYSDFMLYKVTTLAHELTHAKQFQQMLSAQGAKEKLIDELYLLLGKIGETKEDFTKRYKKNAPFVFEYKPKKSTTFDTEFKETGKRSNAQITYSNNTVFDKHIMYNSANREDYLLNPLEISAKIGEENFLTAVLEKEFSKTFGFNEDIVDYMAMVKATNNTTLANIYNEDFAFIEFLKKQLF